MAVSIRPFQETDLDRVLDIAVAAWQPVFSSSREMLGSELFDLANADPDEEKRRQVREACREDSGQLVWVAEVESELVGFITAKLNRHTLVGEIGNNAVDPDSHHRGTGTVMYQFVLERMREGGMRVATVNTGADEAHAPARRAYEKAGFSRSVPSVRYYQEL